MRRFRLPAGLLSALLGTAALCGGAHQAQARQQNRTTSCSTPRAGSNQIALVSGKRQAAPPPQEVNKLHVGDLVIAYATTSEYLPNTGAYHWVGTKTEIEVPDKASNSVLYVHADDIKAARAGKSEFGLITLNGNVRYRIVQKADDGNHTLEGTAGHAEIRRTTKRIELTGGVRAKLTDAARFSGPANLRTGSLTVLMESKAYRYNLEGTAANNDIQFIPLQTPTAKAGAKTPPAVPVGNVHVFGFRSGELQFGKSIHLQGTGTTCDFASPDEKTAWHLQGEQFEGEFVPDTSDLQRATVTENVKFHITQPSADKKSKTAVDGTSPQTSYVRSQTGQEAVIHGPFDIHITDPEHLEEPGTIVAEKASATVIIKKVGDQLSYKLDDPQNAAKMTFLPKSLDTEQTKPAVLTGPK